MPRTTAAEGMLDLRNPDGTVETELIANHWLDDLGVDGFRIHAAKHLVVVDAAT